MKINNYKYDLVQCKICGYETTNHQSFNSYITHAHHIKSKEYYDTYLKQQDEGICKTCGKPTKFIGMWKTPVYRSFCCNSCAQRNSEIQNKKKETSNLHFGVDHPMKSQIIQDKIKNIMREKYNADNFRSSEYGKALLKQIWMKHYGVDNPAKAEEVKESIRQTNRERYGCDWVFQNPEIQKKQQNTLYMHYGVIVPYKSPIIKQRGQDTCKQKYGVSSALSLPYVRQRTYETAYTHAARSKARKTAIKNGNHSKLEDSFEQFLIEHDIKYNTEYNKDSRYPYHCDFYLPDKDLFIEIHGFWMHNNHLFTNFHEDLVILNMWKEKSKTHLQYITAIDVWTRKDIEKYNCAKQNNLNYVILWNKNDIDIFCKTLI